MNKAFKVLWNEVRELAVVSSEAQKSHGKPKKAIATAVLAGLLAVAGTAGATDITNGSFGAGGQLDSTKFISGNGSLTVNTNGSFGNLASAIQNGSLSDILAALGTGTETNLDGTPKYVTLVGAAGGGNYSDSGIRQTTQSDGFKALADSLGSGLGDKLDRTFSQFQDIEHDIEGGASLIIGDGTNVPLMIASVGGDRVLGTAMSGVQFGVVVPEDVTYAVTRHGNVSTQINSGNILLLTGGSSAINIKTGKLLGILSTEADSTSVTIEGSTSIDILGSTTTAGVFGGGSAVALGGLASSLVTQGATIHIDTQLKSQGNEGYHVGVVGGGLAIGTMGGQATSTVRGETHIQIDNGLAVGVIGSGIAAVTDPQSIIDALPIDNELVKKFIIGALEDGATKGGVANICNDVVKIDATGGTTLMQMGGGLTLAVGGADSTSSVAKSQTTSVVMNLGGNAVTESDKGTLVSAVEGAFNVLSGLTSGSLDLSQITTITKNLEGLKGNAHVANLGGGLAVGYATNPGTQEQTIKVSSNSHVDTVEMYMTGGYNVGNLAGGIAVAFGTPTTAGTDSNPDSTQVSAIAGVDRTFVNISGGENILTAGGGLSLASIHRASGDDRPGSGNHAVAIANVEKATINITGGSADGVFGGGMAIDDTNAEYTNAIADTNTVRIRLNGDEAVVNNASLQQLIGMIDQPGGPDMDDPLYSLDVEEMLKDTVDLIDSKKVAILGGGMATGAGAQANSDSVSIDLAKGTVNGNVFGGGAATFSGKTNVKEVSITLNGATVNGDIYAGGLAGSKRNDVVDRSWYHNAESSVETATLTLLSGTINGNVYAGGAVYDEESQKSPSSTVKESTIEIGSDLQFGENAKTVDGQGADTSHLKFSGDVDMTGKSVIGFNTIQGNGASGIDYSFGNKASTDVIGASVNFASVDKDAEDKVLNVGNEDATGIASIAAVNGTGSLALNVNNGLLAVGVDSTDEAVAAMRSAPLGEAYGYVTGDSTKILSNGTVLNIGGMTTEATEGIVVGTNGVLIADANGDTQANVNTLEGKVHFANVATAAESADKTVIFTGEGISSITDENITVDNVLYKAVENETEAGTYSFEKLSAEEYGSAGLSDFDDVGFLEDISTVTDNPAADFINSFLDQSNSSITNGNRTAQLNAAVNLATAAGVQTAAIDGASMGIEAAAKRASILNDFAKGGRLFAEISGKTYEMGGSSNFNAIKADMGGLIFGGEYTTDEWTVGALGNVGTGTVRGQDENSGVHNSVDYYGLQAYVGKRFGAFNLIGQVGYLMTENDIDHTFNGSNSVDVDADVISVGVRGEYRFDLTEAARLVPYIGLNYLRVSTDGYSTSKGVNVDDIDQNLVTMPVGLKVAASLNTVSGWSWSPSADLAYVAAFGDNDVEAVSDIGTAATANTTMDVWAENVFRMGIGLKAQKDNFGVGLEAGTALGSEDMKQFFGQLRVDYRF